MHQIHFLLGLCPRPRWGAYSAPDSCLYLRGLLLRGWRETGKRAEKVKGKEGKRWREGFGPPKNFGVSPLHVFEHFCRTNVPVTVDVGDRFTALGQISGSHAVLTLVLVHFEALPEPDSVGDVEPV